MQRKKILVMCTALILASLVLPIASLPRAHAFVSSIVSLSGLGVNGFSDPLTGALVDGIGAGSTLTVTAALLAPSTPTMQHNVTVGFKGEWMNQYQNATNAGPASTLSLTASQTASVTISITVPSTGGLTPYSWTVIVCDGLVNAKTTSCSTTSSGSPYHPLAVYTSDQLSAAQASVQATSAINSVTTAISLIPGSLGQRPGTTAAAGQIAQANTEMSLGTQSWRTGDYGGARTHYQNALNDANAAAGSLTGQGGGVDTASLVNLVLGGTGIALIGVGALLAGLGVFVHYIRKPKP